MKLKVIKLITFIIVCGAMVFLTNRLSQGTLTAAYTEMKNASIPVAYVQYEDGLINCLHGYRSEVDFTLLHEAVTPVTENKELCLWVDSGGGGFDGYSYEVRALDGSLVESGDITKREFADGYIKCYGQIRMDMENRGGYVYILKLASGEQDIRYYTRIVMEDSTRIKAALNFVRRFHDATFQKDDEDGFLAGCLKPDEKRDNNTLHRVTMESSYHCVTYADMEPTVISQVIPSIEELNADFLVCGYRFVMASEDEENTYHYNVDEHFKVRVQPEGVTLLDYARTQEELFNYRRLDTMNNSYRIGVSDAEEIAYLTADKGKKSAFVREGQLWYYDYSASRIVRVFSFWQEDYLNVNTTYNQHDIRPISMDDKGNLVFAVIGYMNRGEHEGCLGIAFYTYFAESDRTEELLFAETTMPYPIMKHYTDKLLYMNSRDEAYMLLGDSVYQVTKDGVVTVIKDGLLLTELAVSEDRRQIAFPENSDLTANQKIIRIDLDKNDTKAYAVNGSDRIRAIGFVEDDLVCGKAKEADIIREPDGNCQFPLYATLVMTPQLEVQKEYTETDRFVIDAYTKGESIYFKRATRVGDEFKDAEDDFITYKDNDEAGQVQMQTKGTERALNVTSMVFPSNMYVKSVPSLLITKEAVTEDVPTAVLMQSGKNHYYVYNTSGISDVYQTAGKALYAAISRRGIVLNAYGQQIWNDEKIQDYFTVTDRITPVHVEQKEESLAACYAMTVRFAGGDIELSEVNTDWEQLLAERTGKSGIHYVDCTVDMMLYYLSNGVPLITKIEEDHYVLLTSYNGVAVRYIDPLVEESVKLDRKQFGKLVDQAGGEFYTYVP